MNGPLPRTLVCTTTAATPTPHVPGSVARTAACGHEVWVAPSGAAMPDVELLCVSCAALRARADGVMLLPPTAAQRAELERRHD